jgi:hypothetical protein
LAAASLAESVMNNVELRNLDDARRYLLQGLWWQRVLKPEAVNVRPALEWYHEMSSDGRPLPPIGFVADIGQVAFGSDWELRGNRNTLALAALPANLVSTYEDHVLGKVYADWTFARASDALRHYTDRDRARGLAYLMGQFRERAQFPGVEFSPGIIKNALDADPAEVLAQGWESLRQEPLPLLTDMYTAMITSARRTAEILGPEDVFELEHKTALANMGNRLGLRQVLKAAAAMEASMGKHKLKPLARRMEVPTRILDEDQYPVGGYTSISTRGSIESLLHSQLAFIEPDPNDRPDLFDIKFLRDELYYYSRDENQFLRRRRTFAIALHSDLVETRFKDDELPFQRGILMLGLLVALVKKLTEWLSTDALQFHFLFLGPEDKPPALQTEMELLQVVLREQIINGTVFLEQVPTELLAARCANWARNSMCHALNISTAPVLFDAQDTVVTLLRVNGPRPAIGDFYNEIAPPQADDALDCWNLLLQGVIQRWI